MKRSTYVWIIILIFIVIISIAVISLLFYQFRTAPSVQSDSYLEIPLSGEIHERAAPNIFSFMTERLPLSMHDIWWNLRKAKKDTRIKGVILRLGLMQCDWAKADEIRNLILDFRRSGKKAFAYIDESFDFDKEYYLATACDQIILHPEGMLIVNGIGGYVPFFKQALKNLGIEAEVEKIGEYKTAYNMFIEDEFTSAHREMLDSIYKNIYDHYVDVAAQARGKPSEHIRNLLNQGVFQGNAAQESSLIDGLLYEDEFRELLKGENKKFNRISHAEYVKISPSSLGLNRGRKIALIYGTGPIVTGKGAYSVMGSRTVSEWIRKAKDDDSIAAIVFRVDSPGGSVVASDTIWREVSLAKKKKPVIVSMSDLAGSGGYQVSMAAHSIVAHPQTLTGSIGVIFAKFNFAGLYRKLGITAEKIQYGDRADMFTTFRSATQEERELLDQHIRQVYQHFITKVAAGRNMSKEKVDDLGQGRVWTGAQAVELGLADELGGLSQAIQIAKEKAGIPLEEEVRLQVWPRKISLWDALMSGRFMAGNGFLHKIPGPAGEIYSLFQKLEHEFGWALMPFWIAPN
ncbi:MAG: signal peptide peptidase SppA [Candidatus Aminicenantes bacterium]